MDTSQGSDSASSLPTGLRLCPSKRYAEMHRRSLEEPERFWSEEARGLDWYKTWDRVLDWTPPLMRGGLWGGCSMPAISVLTAMQKHGGGAKWRFTGRERRGRQEY